MVQQSNSVPPGSRWLHKHSNRVVVVDRCDADDIRVYWRYADEPDNQFHSDVFDFTMWKDYTRLL